MELEQMKDFRFYRISTDINGKIFLHFKNNLNNHSIYLKHNIIKNKGISFYHDTTLYDIFKHRNDIKKYIINMEE